MYVCSYVYIYYTYYSTGTHRVNDVVEAHCYVVYIGRTDREHIHVAEFITSDAEFCTQLTKAYVA